MLRDVGFSFSADSIKNPHNQLQWPLQIFMNGNDLSIIFSERYKKKILMITHAKHQQLFDLMVSFVFCLSPGYFLKPYVQCHDN